MNRLPSLALCLLWMALVFCFTVDRPQAQATPPAAPPQDQAQKPAAQPSDKDAKDADDDDADIFTPEPSPTLPPGMKGADANDPRAKLSPGLYDAAEAAMGIQHLLLLKKPDAFQLGTTDLDDPHVGKMEAQLIPRSNKKI